MMQGHPLDHIGIAVSDLADAEQLWRRLGFHLTPRSQHFGSRTPEAAVEPFGSSNHCAMLRTGYVEIVGLSDPSLFSRVPPMLAKYEGIHIVAFGCTNADATHGRLREAKITAPAPVALQRNVPFGVEGTETRRVAFRNINVDTSALPEARFILIEHLTREVMWQPHLLEHPNTATALSEVWIVSGERMVTAARLSALLSCAVRQDDEVSSFELPHGRLHICDHAIIGRLFPGALPPRLPWVGAVSFHVSNLETARSLLDANGIGWHGSDDAVWVDQTTTKGPIVMFTQNKSSVRRS